MKRSNLWLIMKDTGLTAESTILAVRGNYHCNQNLLSVSFFCWLAGYEYQFLLMMWRYLYTCITSTDGTNIPHCCCDNAIKYPIGVSTVPLTIFVGIDHIIYTYNINQGLWPH